MTDTNTLYAQLKPQLESVATPLINFSKQCLRDHGDFLPHAAVLTAQDKVELVGAHSGRELANAAEILPLLHGALRSLAKEKALAALGGAESVTINLPGQPSTKAIKVLFEHRRGLTVSLYVPYEKNPQKGFVFSPMLSMLAEAEVKAFQGMER